MHIQFVLAMQFIKQFWKLRWITDDGNVLAVLNF